MLKRSWSSRAVPWTLGYAYQLQGDRAAASRVYTEILSLGKPLGDSIYTIVATLSLGQIQETNNQLSLATQTYQRVLQLAGDPPLSIACEAHLGLARILYQWNDLAARTTMHPIDTADSKHRYLRFVYDIARPSETGLGRCGRRGYGP